MPEGFNARRALRRVTPSARSVSARGIDVVWYGNERQFGQLRGTFAGFSWL